MTSMKRSSGVWKLCVETPFVKATGPSIVTLPNGSTAYRFIAPASAGRPETSSVTVVSLFMRMIFARPLAVEKFGAGVKSTTTAGGSSAYTAPMLNVRGMKRGDDTQLKVNLTGALTGSRVNFNIEPRKDGPTVVIARFHELKEAPADQVYVLWAVSPDNKYTKLGQIVNTGQRNEAEIKSETALPDFGLLITLQPEGADPAGEVVVTAIK